ncbi:MAG: class A beta-lactamase [Streptomyces sp.]|uniref:class A beta-lactamase n=1 Tax=Streptomyces sp. TaxID=1931 RepID=UPI0025E46E6C|nr:class A beta-lactamase [Streptomyces sp.]MBW8793343.1 class A beta-lactamase [Streptomyces sp.]
MRNPSRRTVPASALGAAVTTPPTPGATGRLRALERERGARLGVFARDTASGARLGYRSGELFPMRSVHKPLAVAAVLRDLGEDVLGEVVHYDESDVERAGGAPVTGKPENLAAGMTVAELCGASISSSDNTAANLLLEQLGGPVAVTRLCRSLGDGVTRLDRWEPELNSAEPGRVTDTTTPLAIATTYAKLTVGHALNGGDRRRLTGRLLANTTGGERIRAGLPGDWTVGDKTGTGGYGTANDVAIAWPPGRAPLVVAVLSTHADAAAEADSALVRKAAAIVADAFGRGGA